MSDFSEISTRYEKNAIVQKSAGDVLFDLLMIQPDDNVLDIGCGTGHISKLIREKTNGKVVAVDPSAGMIKKAREKFANQGISFRVCSAQELDYQNEFDIIFCNSAFQWFADPARAIKACLRSLRSGGKMAIQAPAKDNYCPNFIRAIEKVKTEKETRDVFCHFTAPWFFRDTAEKYTELFEAVGFNVVKSSIDEVVTRHPAAEVYRIFESGAAAGYLNPAFYNTDIPPGYMDAFRHTVRRSFEEQADRTGQVQLTFYRIYLLGIKKDG